MEGETPGQKMNQEAFKTKMKTIFYNMDIKNNICADCGKKKSMDYASINNGIIICADCAKEHEKLGYNISFIRSLGDKWDDYLFNYIKAGGNSRFIQFCKDYKVDKGNNNIIQKYKSKGLTYYRDIIRSEVLGYDPPDNINVNKAYEEEPEIPDNYPEFKKYSFVKHVDMNNLGKNFYQKKEEKVEDEGIFSMIGGLWGSVKKKIGDEAGDLMKKVSEIDYSGVKEIKDKGASMLGYIFGGDDKTNVQIDKENKPITNNEEEIKEKENKKDESIFKSIFGIEIKNYLNVDLKENKINKENKEAGKKENIKQIEKINEINKNEIKEDIQENKNEIKLDKNEMKDDKIDINEIKKDIKENTENVEKIETINQDIDKEINEIKENSIINEKKEINENPNNNIIETNNINYEVEKENNKSEIKKEEMKDSGNNINENNEENIDDILKDNNFNKENSQMNNEEKDELEKILQE